MHFSTFLFSLQLLILGTVYANFAGAISSSQAKPAANSTFHFRIPTADTPSSSFAATPTSTDDAIADLEHSYLTCHTDLPMDSMTGSEVFVEACSKVGKKITLLVTHFNLELKLLRYIEPAIPQELLALDLYAHRLETEHGCQTSDPEGSHCIWLSQLRDELFQLMVKTGGPEKSLNLNLFDSGYYGIDLEALKQERQQILHELNQIVTDFDDSMSLNLGRRFSVFYHTVFEGDRLQELLERVANMERRAKCPEHGPPIVCIALTELREAVALTLETLNREVNTDA